MPATKQQLLDALITKFNKPEDAIIIKATAMDNDHWDISVTSGDFVEKTLIAQHRMVIDALGNYAKTVHAIAIKTKIPQS
jgi:stress-induced morphogen